jgi:hypothetical protein
MHLGRSTGAHPGQPRQPRATRIRATAQLDADQFGAAVARPLHGDHDRFRAIAEFVLVQGMDSDHVTLA